MAAAAPLGTTPAQGRYQTFTDDAIPLSKADKKRACSIIQKAAAFALTEPYLYTDKEKTILARLMHRPTDQDFVQAARCLRNIDIYVVTDREYDEDCPTSERSIDTRIEKVDCSPNFLVKEGAAKTVRKFLDSVDMSCICNIRANEKRRAQCCYQTKLTSICLTILASWSTVGYLFGSSLSDCPLPPYPEDCDSLHRNTPPAIECEEAWGKHNFCIFNHNLWGGIAVVPTFFITLIGAAFYRNIYGTLRSDPINPNATPFDTTRSKRRASPPSQSTRCASFPDGKLHMK
ncbi:MAG: hypothetical protein K9M07_06105 [Simkaniaceae bacterium]|nr:hypothetical protein [Simkaniaceae bacterium]MCF7852795.1 hypothetical protein [Simkaniaceae bacterium]